MLYSKATKKEMCHSGFDDTLVLFSLVSNNCWLYNGMRIHAYCIAYFYNGFFDSYAGLWEYGDVASVKVLI